MNNVRGIVWVPLLAMIGAVVAFGVMAYIVIKGYQKTTNTNTAVTNTTTNTVVTNLNTNSATNTNVANTNTSTNTQNSVIRPGGIYGKIYDAVQTDTKIRLVYSPEAKNLPTGIYPVQTSFGFTLGNLHFLSIKEHTISPPIPEGGVLQWAGLLVSNDNETSWTKYFSVPLDDVFGYSLGENIVGLFVKDKKLYLDAADNRGAGSGEGDMVRLVSSDGGYRWEYVGCYYYTPEAYFEPDNPPFSSITPDGLKTIPGTCFSSQLLNANKRTSGSTTTIPADWKTYTNSKYHYSFRYPSNWLLDESHNDGDATTLLDGDWTVVRDPNDVSHLLIVCPDGTGCVPYQDGQWTTSDRTVIVAGKNATERTYTYNDVTGPCPTCLPVVSINFNEEPQGWTSSDKDIIYKTDSKGEFTTTKLILSTFQFTQ